MSHKHLAAGAAIVLTLAVVFFAGCAALAGDDPTPTATASPVATATRTPPPTSTAMPSPTVTPVIPAGQIEVKVGQLIMGAFEGTTADGAAALIQQYHVGNVTLLGRNTGAPEQVLALTQGLQSMALEANGVGMLISADQEGGRVVRLRAPFTKLPPAAVIGCIGETEFARQAGLVTGTELLAAGVNVNLAPSADVLTNPANTVIGDRAFGTTYEVVMDMVRAQIDGLHQAGVASTIKHFPGHGMTSDDSHEERIVVDATYNLEIVDLPPFTGPNAAHSDLLMTSNIDVLALDPAGVPASLSRPVMEFIRSVIGFQGVIITDALEMRAVSDRWSLGEAAVRAIEAGADMVLYGRPIGGIEAAIALTEAVRSGRISEARLDESIARIAALKQRMLAQVAQPLSAVGSPEHTALVDLMVRAAAERGC